jgi:raffinose/stachyose/melibiose transport system substrate-binding protein
MNVHMTPPRRWATAAVLAMALATSACGGSSNSSTTGSANTPVTLTWWHNADQEPGRGVWQSVADAYHQAHPNVSFKISPTQNETLKTKVPVALQSADPPSIFQQWAAAPRPPRCSPAS